MMLAYKFVRLIEHHSGNLAEALLRRVQESPLTADYKKVPPDELKDRPRGAQEADLPQGHAQAHSGASG